MAPAPPQLHGTGKQSVPPIAGVPVTMGADGGSSLIKKVLP